MKSGRTILVCGVFLVSGFPALLYQLVWQRSLFMIYGINVESVTVVVTGFMLGLGLGSLFGGFLSKKVPLPLLTMFGLIELLIGALGISSLASFHFIGEWTLNAPAWIVKVAPIGLLPVPTLFMGATLPILTQYLVQQSESVGHSVSLLYFLNTLGSALACFAAAFLLMRYFGMQGVTYFAAALNGLVGIGALVASLRGPGTSERETSRKLDQAIQSRAQLIDFRWALGLAALVGFISLSQEILWFRSFSFFTGTSAMAFALILGAFLLGIAGGSLVSWSLCSQLGSMQLLRWLAGLILVSSVLGYAIIPLTARLAIIQIPGLALVTFLALVAGAAATLGAAFPLISHLGIAPDDRAGSRLSYLYMANIAGSVAGSLATGFVMLDFLSLKAISVLLAVGGLALALVLSSTTRLHRTWALATTGAALLVVLLSGPLYRDVYGMLQLRAHYGQAPALVQTVENKSGVVTVDAAGTVYGGGMYDGHLNINPVGDPLLVRPLTLSLVHPNPETVLFVGLAGGAWTQLVANHPSVKKVKVIEINPGYLEVVRNQPSIRSVLDSPKVELIIDDARRWLRRNDEKFDVVFQNTTFFFRSNATNLLSAEYLHLVNDHLKPGGVNIYNTTWSTRAQRTACLEFPNSLRIQNHMYVSNTPISLDAVRWRESLVNYQVDGKPLVDLSSKDGQAWLDEVIGMVKDSPTLPSSDPNLGAQSRFFEYCASILARTNDVAALTDDNMGDEWRYFRSRKVFR